MNLNISVIYTFKIKYTFKVNYHRTFKNYKYYVTIFGGIALGYMSLKLPTSNTIQKIPVKLFRFIIT